MLESGLSGFLDRSEPVCLRNSPDTESHYRKSKVKGFSGRVLQLSKQELIVSGDLEPFVKQAVFLKQASMVHHAGVGQVNRHAVPDLPGNLFPGFAENLNNVSGRIHFCHLPVCQSAPLSEGFA